MFTETSYVCVLTAKFGLSSMVLANFRQEGGNFILLPPPEPPRGGVLGGGPGLGLVGLRASETRSQVFSCKFCEMFQNTFFIEQLRWLLLCLIFFWSRGAPEAQFALAMPGPCVFYLGVAPVWVLCVLCVCCSCVLSGAAVWCVVLGCVCVNCVGWSLSGDGGIGWV